MESPCANSSQFGKERKNVMETESVIENLRKSSNTPKMPRKEISIAAGIEEKLMGSLTRDEINTYECLEEKYKIFTREPIPIGQRNTMTIPNPSGKLPYYGYVVTLLNIFDEIMKYRLIGTVEGCRKAVEAYRQPKIVEWIPCSERMPEEHESFYARFKGTDEWRNTMFEKSSSEVNATIEFEDGKRAVKTLHTIDGRWNEGNRGLKFKVVAWQTLPDPYKTEE